MSQIEVYLEKGQKKVFACALDWPGWARSGRDEEQALQTLKDYGARYTRVVQPAGLDFQPPEDVRDFTVSRRMEGNATTDFGAPAIILDADSTAIDALELARQRAILQACWGAFDRAVRNASGKSLQSGPRGGGRDLEKITSHILEADRAYLARLAWKTVEPEADDPLQSMSNIRQEILKALEAAEKEDLPKQGPRGGLLWPVRYFLRRVAWHVLDHTWEIEDRLE
jgi:hypothetical protein